MSSGEQSAAKNAEVDTLRFRLTIAFDGTAYAGWQVQQFGTGVQEQVEQALERLFGVALRLHSSSRTDAGVHALGMVAHVDVPRPRFRMPMRKFALATNAHLPEDIRILSAVRAAPDFHARFQATGKEYRYYLWNHRAMNPLLRGHAWHVPKPLDVPAMRQAASLFVGRHDFRSFTANRGQVIVNTVRQVTLCALRRRGPLLVIAVRADGFLYKMCRGMVGTLVQVGQRKYQVEDVRSMLRQGDRRLAGMTAPAHGLVLWKVFYSRKAANRAQDVLHQVSHPTPEPAR